MDKLLGKKRVVAAVKDDRAFDSALSSGVEVIFMLKSDLLTAKERVDRAHAYGKKILLHIDLMDGIGRDEAAVRFVAERIRPDGIISTKSLLIRQAKELGLYAVFRVFLIDSQGVSTAIANAKKLRPDAVELMPGLVTKLVGEFKSEGCSVILGGLVSDGEEVERGIAAGATALSTSFGELWGR